MRMDCQKSQVHPQKQPYMRMDDRKSKVCPQKEAKMWMDRAREESCADTNNRWPCRKRRKDPGHGNLINLKSRALSKGWLPMPLI